MKGIRQFGRELSAIVRNKKVLIPVIAILLVPVLYSGLFLNAFWDPYDKMEDLPVAVVNSDAGADFNGKTIAVGDEFIDKLKDNKVFKWDFVDKATAEEGLKSNTYYMAIEIPENFSQQTTTLTSDQPTPAIIQFLPNESLNFLASQIGGTAVDTMKAQLNKEVTKEYARTVFDQVTEMSEGLASASNGATEIADGTVTAKDGAQKIADNLKKLTEGSVTIQDGVKKLVTGSTDLEKGAGQLNTGLVSLTDGMKQLGTANGQLSEGAVEADKGAKQLNAGLEQSKAGAGQVEAGSAQLTKALEQYAAAVPALAEDPNFQKIIESSKTLAAGASSVAKAQDQLSAGASSLSGGLDKLVAGLDTFGTKLNDASAGSKKLVAGSASLKDGSQKLHSGLGSLSDGLSTVVSGTGQLSTGAVQLTDGLVKLTDGTGELSSKLGEAADATASIKVDEGMFDMFANPINSETVVSESVPNYGTGFAPYFISLGLFVGALLLTIVFAVKEPAIQPPNGWSWFISKMLVMLVVGLLQSLIVDAILLFGLGLEVQNVGLFCLFTFISSICFMSLIQFLVTVFGQPGRFIAIVVLIFQLTTSAGTFPLELIPNWMQGINTWLPMTYTVSGFKAVVSSGDFSALWNNVGILMIYFVIFSALTLTYFITAHRREKNDGAVSIA